MTKINQEEYELLKSFDDKWKWIARDRGGVLWIYEDRPEIFKGTQTWDDLKDSCVYLENDLFHFIQWEDEEPYSIAELIEEYEEAQMTYFDNKLVKELDNFIEESKEAEARKGIEWLKEEVWKQDIIMDKGYIYTDDLMSIINEVDEPEVKQLERKIKELDSYNDELIRDNNQLRDELDSLDSQFMGLHTSYDEQIKSLEYELFVEKTREPRNKFYWFTAKKIPLIVDISYMSSENHFYGFKQVPNYHFIENHDLRFITNCSLDDLVEQFR